MRAAEILEKALDLLGYQKDSYVLHRSIVILNTIYSELYFCCNDSDFVPIKGLSDEVKFDDRALYNIMPYGVAMLIAGQEADVDLQRMFSEIYNSRLALLSRHESIKDNLPKVCE